jgi:hypothetical protein
MYLGSLLALSLFWCHCGFVGTQAVDMAGTSAIGKHMLMDASLGTGGRGGFSVPTHAWVS